MNYHIEIERTNVTVKQFLSYVKKQCEAKGIGYGGVSFDDFTNPTRPDDSRYFVLEDKAVVRCNGKEIPAWEAKMPCKSEIYTNMPDRYQMYILNWDGSCYNEIIE